MKIAVYAISKNEEAFIQRCIESAKDADYFVLADTGSTDQTVRLAREAGATVHEITVSPWRFDHARNAALALVPSDADVCVALDVDEVMEDGWRAEVERAWEPDTTRLRYLFDWGHGIRFMSEKVHTRRGYYWKFPCHENLVADARIVEKYAATDKLLITHHADPAKSRSQYLDLLRVGAEEFPTDPRTAFYYGRELFFHGSPKDAIQELSRYLELPTATWKDERSAVMRYIGKAFKALGDVNQSSSWFQCAAREAPYRREPWLDIAGNAYEAAAWVECLWAVQQALAIEEGQDSWLSEPTAWSARPYDLAAVASYRLGKYAEAILWGERAVALAPQDERLSNNLAWYHKATVDFRDPDFLEKAGGHPDDDPDPD